MMAMLKDAGAKKEGHDEYGELDDDDDVDDDDGDDDDDDDDDES